MIADRELDALVAQHWMGWRPSPVGHSAWQQIPPGGDGTMVRLVPPYSSQMGAAWEVVEQLAFEGFYLSIADMRHGCYGETRDGEPFVGFWAHVVMLDVGGEYPTQAVEDVGAATAPRAICLAALLVKGVRVPGV
jgi:hypothetical protein